MTTYKSILLYILLKCLCHSLYNINIYIYILNNLYIISTHNTHNTFYIRLTIINKAYAKLTTFKQGKAYGWHLKLVCLKERKPAGSKCMRNVNIPNPM